MFVFLSKLVQISALLALCACAARFEPPQELAEVVEHSTSFESINKLRISFNSHPLLEDSRLTDIASLYARKLAAAQKLSHDIDDSFETRMRNFGLHSHVAENLTVGPTDKDSALRAWMRSELHKQNILNSKYRRYGLSNEKSIHGQMFWVLVLSD